MDSTPYLDFCKWLVERATVSGFYIDNLPYIPYLYSTTKKVTLTRDVGLYSQVALTFYIDCLASAHISGIRVVWPATEDTISRVPDVLASYQTALDLAREIQARTVNSAFTFPVDFLPDAPAIAAAA